MENLSVLGQRCVKFGLDPNNTSIFELECVKWGLDPKKSSILELKCVQMGLSKKPSILEMKEKGIDASGYLEIWTEDQD